MGVFLFSTTSRMALGPTQPPSQWVPEALSLGVKWPGCDADHSPPSTAKVMKCVELYFHSSNMPPWHGAQLQKKKHRDNFTFTFTFTFKQQLLILMRYTFYDMFQFVCIISHFEENLYKVLFELHNHHSMVCPQVVVGGYGLHILRVTAYILNNQSQAADKGWSSNLRVGQGTNNSSL
jgi:hypothetical protein